MRNLMVSSAAICFAADTALAAGASDTSVQNIATDGQQDGDDEAVESEELEAFSFEAVNNGNVKEIASALFARMEGEKYGDKVDLTGALITALREVRDEGRTKRVKADPAVVIAESIGKAMSELQAVRFTLAGIPLSLPQIMNIVESEKGSPMKAVAKKFVEEHKLITVKEKVKSKGKETKFLRKEGYVAPVKPEAEAKAA